MDTTRDETIIETYRNHQIIERELYSERDIADMLDTYEDEVVVAGLRYSPSDVLSSVDPTAWRCHCNDSQEYEYVVTIDDDEQTYPDMQGAYDAIDDWHDSQATDEDDEGDEA
jgi:hypothetical protein